MQLYWLLLLAPSPALSAIFTGWYTGWHATDFPLSSVSWSKYTHMTYAFATPTNDSTTIMVTPADEQLLPQFVQTARQHGVKTLLSIGGWAGSEFFSSSVATEEARKGFVNATLGLAEKYGLDGIDFDWEFPNRQGIGCNQISPNSEDVPNFLTYLQQLRQDPRGSSLILSAAVPIQPYNWNFTTTDYFTSTFLNPSNASAFANGDSSNSTRFYGAEPSIGPSGYLSSFASVLDFIAIMNYDVWNPAVPYAFSTGPNEPVVTRVGPHSALDDTCVGDSEGDQGKKRGSAKTSVDAWVDAGFSKDKIVLGVAAYGHSFAVKTGDAFANTSTTSNSSSTSEVQTTVVSSTASSSSPSTSPSSSSNSSRELASYPPYDPSLTHVGDKWDSGEGEDSCGNHVFAGGLYAFRGLIEEGYLTSDGQEVGGNQMVYRWDDCSQTPFVYNTQNETMVSYDNSRSFAAKGTFISSTGLAGFAMWEVAGDSNDILLDSIRNAIDNATTSGGMKESTNSASISASFGKLWVLAAALICAGFC